MYKMAKDGDVFIEGGTKNRVYYLNSKKK